MDWINLLTSAAGGGVLGLFGTGIKMWFTHKKEEARLKQEVLVMQESRKNMEMELQIAKQKGALDLEIMESDADAKGLQAAIIAEGNITNVHRWVNDVRAMVRPTLTVMLVIFVFIKPDEDDIAWMASTAVTFWFGDRPPKKR